MNKEEVVHAYALKPLHVVCALECFYEEGVKPEVARWYIPKRNENHMNTRRCVLEAGGIELRKLVLPPPKVKWDFGSKNRLSRLVCKIVRRALNGFIVKIIRVPYFLIVYYSRLLGYFFFAPPDLVVIPCNIYGLICASSSRAKRVVMVDSGRSTVSRGRIDMYESSGVWGLLTTPKNRKGARLPMFLARAVYRHVEGRFDFFSLYAPHGGLAQPNHFNRLKEVVKSHPDGRDVLVLGCGRAIEPEWVESEVEKAGFERKRNPKDGLALKEKTPSVFYKPHPREIVDDCRREGFEKHGWVVLDGGSPAEVSVANREVWPRLVVGFGSTAMDSLRNIMGERAMFLDLPVPKWEATCWRR